MHRLAKPTEQQSGNITRQPVVLISKTTKGDVSNMSQDHIKPAGGPNINPLAGAAVVAVIIIGGLWYYLANEVDLGQGATSSNPAPVGNTADAPASAVRAEPDEIPDDRFAQVAKIFTDKGATVDARDPKYPNTMRVRLSEKVSLGVSAHDARKLAVMARERLSKSAIVYIKDDTGKTLGKASPMGVE